MSIISVFQGMLLRHTVWGNTSTDNTKFNRRSLPESSPCTGLLLEMPFSKITLSSVYDGGKKMPLA